MNRHLSIHWIVLILFALPLQTLVHAQSASSFDLVDRWSRMHPDTSSANQIKNSFDIRGTRVINRNLIGNSRPKTDEKIEYHFEAKPIVSRPYFTLFSILLACLSGLSFANRSIYQKIFSSLYSEMALKHFMKEAPLNFVTNTLVLYLFWLVNLSIFLALGVYFYGFSIQHPVRIFIAILPWVLLIFGLKYLIWEIFIKVYNLEKILRRDATIFSIGNIVAGIIFFGLNILLVYSGPQFSYALWMMGIILLATLTGHFILFAGASALKELNDNFLEIMLYLCVLEITPVIIVSTCVLRILGLS